MKVLFAVGNAALSENIAKKYLELYGEKIEYKDVFYFKAILEEVKRDKSYDRIVIAEQLEPTHNNIIAEIDKMLFNNIDSITDEIDDTAIIFICSENRTREDSLLARFYSIGLYNVLTGDERQVPNLCRLIKEPRGKKEAKEYLKGNVDVQDPVLGNDDGVNEDELLSICRYFDNLRSPEEYINAFKDVVGQYEKEEDLQTIVAALTTQLRRGNEIFDALNSEPRFQRYCTWRSRMAEVPETNPNENKKGGLFHNVIGTFKNGKNAVGGSIRSNIENRNQANTYSKNSVNSGNDKGVFGKISNVIEPEDNSARLREEAIRREEEQERLRQKQLQELKEKEEQLKRQEEELLRKRDDEERRLRDEKFKAQQEAYNKAQQEAQIKAQQEAQIKAQQEAQIKAQQEAQIKAQQEAQIKAQQEAQIKAQQEAQLKAQQEAQLKAQQEAQLRAQQEAQLRAQQEELIRQQQEAQIKAQQEELRRQQEELRRQQQKIQSGASFGPASTINYDTSSYDSTTSFASTPISDNAGTAFSEPEQDRETYYTGRVLQVPSDYKKVVAFVGTSKIGTSFLANSVGTLLSHKGVKVSILDMTKNRGLYWYYSYDIAAENDLVATCMSNLSSGVAHPITIGKSKNLSLYTTVPKGKEDNRKAYKHRTVVDTAKRNCNLLIIDCDFTTPIEYLEFADDIYIVSDLDMTKCRETVEYLRNLRDRRVGWDKLRLIINNCFRCKVTPKTIRKEELTLYSDPNMTYTEEIEEIRKFVEVPMDSLNYATYIEGMGTGRLVYDKYTEPLKASLEVLSKMVYGIPGKKKGIFGG